MSEKTPPPVAPANQDPQQIEAARQAAALGRELSLDRLAALDITLPEGVDRVIVTSYYDRGDLDPSGEGQGGQPAHDELGIQATNIHGRPLDDTYGVVSGFSMRAERYETHRKRTEGFVDAQLSC